MTQNRYSLSDSDMLGITEAIDGSDNIGNLFLNAFNVTWNAILAQEGKSLNDFGDDNLLNVFDYAIPRDQSAEINDRMIKRAGAIGINAEGVTSILLEWMNVGPSTYDDEPIRNSTDHILPPPYTHN